MELKDELSLEYEAMNLDAFNKLIKASNDKIDAPFVKPDSIKYIVRELLNFKKDLPLAYESSIFHRCYPENMKFHECIITGPEGTPYDSGCFHFRTYCSSTYPDTNPQVNIYTTGNGKVRFNPNLYADGKVCLSLLGTWKGHESESWIPGQSTIKQIWLSIQSLVMISTPYFNEPAYAHKQLK